MTESQLISRVRSEAFARFENPSPHLGAIPLARLLFSLKGKVSVLWPVPHAGLAWDFLDASRRTSSKGCPDRIFYVTTNLDAREELLRLTEIAATRQVKMTVILLSSQKDPGVPTPSPEIPKGFFQRLRYVIRGTVPTSSTFIMDEQIVDGNDIQALESTLKDGSDGLVQISLPSNPSHESQGSPESEALPSWFSVLREESPHLFAVYGRDELMVRFSRAAALADAGFFPVLFLSDEELISGAGIAQDLFQAQGRSALLVSGFEDQGPSSRSGGGLLAMRHFAVLSPGSPEDEEGAVRWALNHSGVSVLIPPGAGGLSSRASLKSPWNDSQGMVVRRSQEGQAGSIVLVVSGTMAKEGAKAVERLSKDGFSATAYSLRFLQPLPWESVINLAQDADLVVLVDDATEQSAFAEALAGKMTAVAKRPPILVLRPSEQNGPFKSRAGRLRVWGLDGASIADAAIETHRRNRFEKTVDEIRRDEWR